MNRISTTIQLAIKTSAAMLFLSGVVCAQGSLTPPGSPAQTMKTLDQVKAGTPISTATYNITSSGNYFLTGNLTVTSGSAIVIDADGVTLDLNGFTISCTGSATGAGILLNNGKRNISIRNGHIKGNFQDGIRVQTGVEITGVYNVRVAEISVLDCGKGITLYYGLATSTIVDSCNVWNVTDTGIKADVVTRTTACQCGGTAIYAYTASDCVASSNYGHGIHVMAAATNCRASSTSGDGIHAEGAAVNCHGTSTDGFHSGVYATTAQSCTGSNSGTGYGLFVGQIATACYGSSSGGTGLRAPLANSCTGSGSPALDVTNKYNMP